MSKASSVVAGVTQQSRQRVPQSQKTPKGHKQQNTNAQCLRNIVTCAICRQSSQLCLSVCTLQDRTRTVCRSDTPSSITNIWPTHQNINENNHTQLIRIFEISDSDAGP